LPPQIAEIGERIERLGYADEPDYAAIEDLIAAAMRGAGASDDDPYDWERWSASVWDGMSVVAREARVSGSCCAVA
jgi:hypothetical protein